ncbi:MAG: hypothetical protein NVV72_10840 [Asticcacaulis sp.]|nr:hypothetical protein [Asticcacaulis sp.]
MEATEFASKILHPLQELASRPHLSATDQTDFRSHAAEAEQYYEGIAE